MMSVQMASFSCPLPSGEPTEIQMGHGSGGRMSAELVERLLLPAFRNPWLEALADQAVLPAPRSGRWAFTTDSFVVTPLFFPGGDIGSLAVHGTVNDLAMGGAVPRYLSLSFILEEGFPLHQLERIVESIRAAALASEVQIVTGDTKVVNRGKADGVFINTAGLGEVPSHVNLGAHRIQEGDAVLVSGTLGDHGVAILTQREGLTFDTPVRSDSAPLHGLVQALLERCPEVHCLRDPTRGGVAASLVELCSRASGDWGVEVQEDVLPLREEVKGACELLGLDPLFVANEGKLVAFLPERDAARALETMRQHPLGEQAQLIGTVGTKHPGRVVVKTRLGTQRIVELPQGELLPRIC